MAKVSGRGARREQHEGLLLAGEIEKVKERPFVERAGGEILDHQRAGGERRRHRGLLQRARRHHAARPPPAPRWRRDGSCPSLPGP